MKIHPDVSIIILTHNTKELTLSCLDSLFRTEWGNVTKEVIIVDNASSDKTLESIQSRYPGVTRIRNPKNLGFAAGNNVGIKKAAGRYVLLLNSDTEVKNNSIPSMISFMDAHQTCGVATCAVFLGNGTLDPACHRGFPTPWASFTYMVGLEKLFPKTTLFGQYHLGYKRMNTPHEIDCPSGAFFLVKKDVIRTVGLLDEDFFMYGEDIDWAYRIKQQGWEIWFNPEVAIFHYKKQSGREHEDKKRRIQSQKYFLTTMKLFYKKHYEKKYGFVLTRFVYLAIAGKLLLFRITGL